VIVFRFFAIRVAHGDWPGYAIGIHQQNQGDQDGSDQSSSRECYFHAKNNRFTKTR
jgi:hypothetical protein